MLTAICRALGPILYGEGSLWPPPYGRPPNPDDLIYGTQLFAIAQKLLDEGRLTHHPVKKIGGGLEGVLKGMEMVRQGQLKGEKCVVTVDG